MHSFLSTVEYDCSHTLYYGPLEDASFAGLDSLEYLAMGYNRYESALPSALVNLPSLEFLYVQDSDLTGSLDFVSDMDLLFEFWFDFNQVTGTIPSDVPATLVSLSATNNLLTGTIPRTLGDLTLMSKSDFSLLKRTLASSLCVLTIFVFASQDNSGCTTII